MPTRRSRSAAGALALALVAAGAAGATPPAPPADPDAPGLTTVQRLAALLERIKLEQAKIQTLEAGFVQKKNSSLLLAPEESRGRFAFQAPDKVVWEFESPSEILVQISGDAMLTWYRDLGTAEKVGIGRQSARVFQFLGAANSLETLQRYFAVKVSFPEGAAEPYRLELTPRFARVAKRLRSMTIELDRRLFFPVRLGYVEPDGDSTEFVFDAVKVNGPIAAERFDVRLPSDVKVTTVDLGR